MFASENTFDEKSGLLQSGKRYKRNFESSTLGQDTKSTPFSLAALEPEAIPSVGNPLVTPQHQSVILENPSQTENNPSTSTPVAGQSTPVSSPCLLPVPLQPPLDILWPT